MTWSGTPRVWTAGVFATAAMLNEISDALTAIASGSATLLYVPGGNLDTTGAGSATWITLGNITVPTWATKAKVLYTMNGVYDLGATCNVTAVMKVGSVAGGVNRRIVGTVSAGVRTNIPVADAFSGLSSGSQSVTISCTFTAGTSVRADTNSFFTALFTFQP